MNALTPRFAAPFQECSAYQPPPDAGFILDLASNTGTGPSPAFCRGVLSSLPSVAAYPGAGALRTALARRFNLDESMLAATSGGDDAIDRICRITLEPGTNAVVACPTFEMIEKSAERTGARVTRVDWAEEFPLDATLAAVDAATRLIAVVTPNNPTGVVVSTSDLAQLADANPGVLVLIDLAYVEFTDSDPTLELLERPNVVIVRTLSKAWGLANLRVGYALGTPAVVSRILAAGGPYAIAGPSVALALAWLRDGAQTTEDFIATVRSQRADFCARLQADGADFFESGANFVCLRDGDEYAVRLAAAGIRVRSWANEPERAGFVRITIPGSKGAYNALCGVLFGGADREAVESLIAAGEGRTASVIRKTKETNITASIRLDGSGRSNVSTGIAFLDHMLDALTKHSRIDLELTCRGDLEVDDHHTAEDCALVMGQLLREALGDRRGIKRFADTCVPLDEALARASIDFSGRPSPNISLDLQREAIGGIATENLTHFLQSLALEGRFALHVDVLKGENDHHKVEAAFKAVARALRSAIARDTHSDVPSTKGVLA